MLEFPTVWIRHEALAGRTGAAGRPLPRLPPKSRGGLAAEQARLAEVQSMVVGERDLAKMTSAQLATLGGRGRSGY